MNPKFVHVLLGLGCQTLASWTLYIRRMLYDTFLRINHSCFNASYC